MPTYEYECQKCAHIFEQFQSMTAAHVKRCPECKGKVKRLLGTGAGIIFKGSGFYETDYKRKSGSPTSSSTSSKSASTASKSSSESSSAATTTTPAAPATKTDTAKSSTGSK